MVLTNILAIAEIKVKKGDRHRVLSSRKIEKVLDEVRKDKGDIYAKAAILMVGVTRAQAFESANRRTAWIATDAFLRVNGRSMRAVYKGGVMTGIREGFYTTEEVRGWLTGHAIKDFQRNQG